MLAVVNKIDVVISLESENNKLLRKVSVLVLSIMIYLYVSFDFILLTHYVLLYILFTDYGGGAGPAVGVYGPEG